ncbi:hypothetical protein BHE90_017319, partial [Fusarium euwallaceae]
MCHHRPPRIRRIHRPAIAGWSIWPGTPLVVNPFDAHHVQPALYLHHPLWLSRPAREGVVEHNDLAVVHYRSQPFSEVDVSDVVQDVQLS